MAEWMTYVDMVANTGLKVDPWADVKPRPYGPMDGKAPETVWTNKLGAREYIYIYIVAYCLYTLYL